MPWTLTTTRAAKSERRTKAATARSEKRRRRRGWIYFPFRRMSETRPSKSLAGTGRSAKGRASPRVKTAPDCGWLPATTRWTKKRRSRPNRTMSPGETASLWMCSITSVSPGITVGNMLHPVTCKRRVPDERNTSPASSHLRAFTSPRIDEHEVMTTFGCWSKLKS